MSDHNIVISVFTLTNTMSQCSINYPLPFFPCHLPGLLRHSVYRSDKGWLMSDCNSKLINVDNMHSFFIFSIQICTLYISTGFPIAFYKYTSIIQCFMKLSDTETLFHSIIDLAKETPILNLIHSPLQALIGVIKIFHWYF